MKNKNLFRNAKQSVEDVEVAGSIIRDLIREVEDLEAIIDDQDEKIEQLEKEIINIKTN